MQKGKQALEGLKVADFSWIIAGPLVAKFLGDHGAEVVHIESSTRADNLRATLPMRDNIPGINRSAAFARYNSSKYGVSLNLSHPKAVEIAKKIVAWADIVLENFNSVPRSPARGFSDDPGKRIQSQRRPGRSAF